MAQRCQLAFDRMYISQSWKRSERSCAGSHLVQCTYASRLRASDSRLVLWLALTVRTTPPSVGLLRVARTNSRSASTSHLHSAALPTAFDRVPSPAIQSLDLYLTASDPKPMMASLWAQWRAAWSQVITEPHFDIPSLAFPSLPLSAGSVCKLKHLASALLFSSAVVQTEKKQWQRWCGKHYEVSRIRERGSRSSVGQVLIALPCLRRAGRLASR